MDKTGQSSYLNLVDKDLLLNFYNYLFDLKSCLYKNMGQIKANFSQVRSTELLNKKINFKIKKRVNFV